MADRDVFFENSATTAGNEFPTTECDRFFKEAGGDWRTTPGCRSRR
jgi:hypothetical protein